MTVSYPPDGQSTIFETRREPTPQPKGTGSHSWRSSSSGASRRPSPLEQAAEAWIEAKARGRSTEIAGVRCDTEQAKAAERA